MIELTTEKGTTQAYLALPTSGSGPGVLLLHAWWGLKPFFTELADQLAGEGYVVLVPDLNFGELVTTVEDARALMERRDDERIALTVLAANNYLRAHTAVQGESIGVIGFSMGAAWAIWLSAERPADVAAVVMFYGSGSADWGATRAAYLGHFAETDEWEPSDDVQAMEEAIRNAGRDVTFQNYPGVRHWFMESDRPEYNPEAAEHAWQRTTAFLREQLKQQGLAV